MKSKDSSNKNNRNLKYGSSQNQLSLSINANRFGGNVAIKAKELFKKLRETAKRRLIKKYLISKSFYNTKCITDIIFNEKSLLVAKFKDFLILDDSSEFLKRFYKKSEQKQRLKKIFDYYNECSKIFPNYIALRESKYIYKNIQRKQRMIDNLQNQENKNKKDKKNKDVNNKDREDGLNSNVFDTKIINSIGDLSTSKFDLNDTGVLDSSIYRKMVKGLNTKCLKENQIDINVQIKKTSLNLNNNSIDSLNTLVKLIDNKGKVKLRLLKNTSFKTPKILQNKEDSEKLIHKTTNNFLHMPTNKYIKDLETIKVSTIEDTNEVRYGNKDDDIIIDKGKENHNNKDKDIMMNNETQTHSRKSSVINDLSKLKKLQINFIEPNHVKMNENITKDTSSLYNSINMPLFQSTKNSMSNINIDYLYGQTSGTGNHVQSTINKLIQNQHNQNIIDINNMNNMTTSRNSNMKKSNLLNENDIKNLDMKSLNSGNSSINTNLVNTLYSSNKKEFTNLVDDNLNSRINTNLSTAKSNASIITPTNQIFSSNKESKDDNKTVYYIINQISNNNHNYYNYNINPIMNQDNKFTGKDTHDSRNKNHGNDKILNLENNTTVKKSLIMPEIKLNSSKIKLNAEIVLSNLKDGKIIETSKNFKSKNKVLFHDNNNNAYNSINANNMMNENTNKSNKILENKKINVNDMINSKSNKMENITPKNKSYVKSIIDDLRTTQSKFRTIDSNSGSKKMNINPSSKDINTNVNKFIRSSNDYYNLDNNDLKNTIKNFYMKSTSQGFHINEKDFDKTYHVNNNHNNHNQNIGYVSNINQNQNQNHLSNNTNSKFKNLSSKTDKTTSNFTKTHYKTNSAL